MAAEKPIVICVDNRQDVENSTDLAMAAKMSGERLSIPLGAGALAGWRFLPMDRAPGDLNLRFIFIHATGFCASTYRQMLSKITVPCEIIALDMRGHGRTNLPTDYRALKDWSIYRDDVLQALAHLSREDERGGRSPRKLHLAGHSMGACTAAMCAAQIGQNQGDLGDIVGLTMIEPVALPSFVSFLAGTPAWPIFRERFFMVLNARKRRRSWPDLESVQDSYKRKAIFASWAEGVLDDYLTDGLKTVDEGVGLSCEPEWEGATFGAQANPFWRSLRRVTDKNIPVTLLAGHGPSSTVPGRARKSMAKMGIRILENEPYGHLLAMEAPGQAAQFIDEVLMDRALTPNLQG